MCKIYGALHLRRVYFMVYNLYTKENNEATWLKQSSNKNEKKKNQHKKSITQIWKQGNEEV